MESSAYAERGKNKEVSEEGMIIMMISNTRSIIIIIIVMITYYYPSRDAHLTSNVAPEGPGPRGASSS